MRREKEEEVREREVMWGRKKRPKGYWSKKKEAEENKNPSIFKRRRDER